MNELWRAAALDSAALDTASHTIASQRRALADAEAALRKVDGKWILGLPCPTVVVGGGVSSHQPLEPALQVTVGFPSLGRGQC